MYTYTYIPPKNPKKVTGIVLLLAAAAALLFFFAALPLNIPFKWLIQLIGIGFISAIIYLTTRYVVKGYEYHVYPRENSERAFTGEYDLAIIETNGKARVTVCRIGLENVSAVMRIEASNANDVKKAIADEKRQRFIYVADINPPIKCCIFAEEAGVPLAITITADDELFELLGKIVFAGFDEDFEDEGEWDWETEDTDNSDTEEEDKE